MHNVGQGMEARKEEKEKRSIENEKENGNR